MRGFRLGKVFPATLCLGIGCLSTALSQTVPAPQQAQSAAAPTDPFAQTKPLTPEEQRQKEIDQFDPLKKSPPTNQTVSKPSAADPRSAPLPGSVAESNAQARPRSSSSDGPQVVDDRTSTPAESYNGPAVLSRSYTIARPSIPREVKWSWTVGSSEVYQTGLVNGGVTNGNGLGTSTSFTFTGRHFWRKDQLGASYGADYSHYYGTSGYNGVNQNLSLDYGHQLSRHLLLSLTETGSIYSNNYSLENPLTAPGVNVANLSLSASPAVQLLDQRTRQFQTTAAVTWQKSSRLSFNFSGGFFAVDRSGVQLTGNTGYQAQSDVNYRYNSKMTVGAYYSFTDYGYTKRISLADTHTIGLIYSYAFGKATQLRLRGGFSRIEGLAYTVVPIDPYFAQLTGQATGIVDSYSLRTTSDASAQFIHDFGRSRTTNISYARGIAPGNGLILTSIQQTFSGSFSARLFRRFNVTASGGRSELTAQARGLGSAGSYTTNYASFSLSRSVARNASATLGVDYRLFNVTGMPGLQSQLRISSGISWSPGPGKLW